MPHLVAALAMAVVVGVAHAHTAGDIVGTWRLVSMVRADSAGQPAPYWDDHPSGLIIYTADGHVAAQLYDSRRARLGIRWESAGPEAARAAYAGLITYFGTYSVDQAAGTVRHAVEGAMTPDWIGTKLVRAFRFVTPNRLELRVVTDATGRPVTNGTVLVWERVRR
ncbi:MAG: lipocalin-like domain-containing protein [Gemmatimonadota bacterium]